MGRGTAPDLIRGGGGASRVSAHLDQRLSDRVSVAHHVPETALLTLAVATATLLVLIGMERLWPHSPAPLVAVGGGIAAAWFFGLQGQGVSTVGLIPQGLPSLTMPDLALIEQLVPGALGIALMSFTETIAAGRAFARPGDPAINANRELVATGMVEAHVGRGTWVSDAIMDGANPVIAVKSDHRRMAPVRMFLGP